MVGWNGMRVSTCIRTCVETLAMCVRLSPGEELLGTRALGIIWGAGGQCMADKD